MSPWTVDILPLSSYQENPTRVSQRSSSYGEKAKRFFLFVFPCLFVFFKHTWLPFSLRIKYILFEWFTRIIFNWPLDAFLVSSCPLLPTLNPTIQPNQTLSVPPKDLSPLGSQPSHRLFHHPFTYLKFLNACSEQSPEETTMKRTALQYLQPLPEKPSPLPPLPETFMSQIEYYIL